MNIKKYISGILVVGWALIGSSALAVTSISLAPTSVNVKAGQTFSVPVSVNPQGVKNYTVGLKLNYPADLVQVQSFSLGSQWMALNQSGYDLVDNTNGVLIKTAGFPQGFSTNTQFGTVTFQAKKTGTGTISLVSGTIALDQSNQNLFAGSSQVSVSVSAATVVAVATPKSTSAQGQAIAQPSVNVSPVVAELVSPTPSPSASPSLQQATILGSIGNVLDLGTDNKIVAIAVAIAIAGGLFWLIRRAFSK